MATFSAACKTIHVSPLPKQNNSDSVGVIQNLCMTSDQGQILGPELNLMEMTEVEYTHLQHIIQIHMEAQAADPDESDARSSAVFALGNLATQPGTTKDDAESMMVSPSSTTQAIDLSTSTDEQPAISDSSHQETLSVQEMKMVLAGDAVGVLGERTPTTCGEVPGPVLAKVHVTRVEAPVKSSTSLLTQPHPPARVCLEKRFNCTPGDIPRQQDVQTAGFSNFLTMFHQSMEAEEAAIYPQMQKWMRSDRTNPIELSQAYRGNIFNPIAGMRGQAFGHIPHTIEPNNNQNLIIPKNFSLKYRSERVSQCLSRTDPTEEQQLVTVENNAVAQTATPAKRVRTRGSRSLKAANPAPDSKKVNSDGTSTRKRAGPRLESSQRRERHNSKERDRRRRIRLSCDELNMLVPFCTQETDKATTLQWTTAFLKYITEVYGDSLKQEFQNTFCSKTGLRLKPSDASVQIPFHQETKETQSAPQAAEQ